MIVITGATGKIGYKVSTQLLAKGELVRVIGRDIQSLEKLKIAGAEVAVGELNDAEFLSSAFTNAKAVLLMLPPDKHTTNFGAFQDDVGNAQLKAIINAEVKHVIFISSQGAHDIEHTGTVRGLGRQERRLNTLPEDVNVLSLRPEAFMENCIESLMLFGTIASPLRPDVRTGLIATTDIANFATEQLLNLNFYGKRHQDLLGDRDYTQSDIAEVVAKALGKPTIKYLQISYKEYQQALMDFGISESRAGLITERYLAINNGYFNNGVRDQISTTPTTLEYFAETVLKPSFTNN